MLSTPHLSQLPSQATRQNRHLAEGFAWSQRIAFFSRRVYEAAKRLPERATTAVVRRGGRAPRYSQNIANLRSLYQTFDKVVQDAVLDPRTGPERLAELKGLMEDLLAGKVPAPSAEPRK